LSNFCILTSFFPFLELSFVPKFFRIPTTFDSNFIINFNRCQFYIHFSSQNTKSIKKTNLNFDFFSREFLEKLFFFKKFLEKNIFEKWTQSSQRPGASASAQGRGPHPGISARAQERGSAHAMERAPVPWSELQLPGTNASAMEI
jgi:hypothetical protein